MSPQPPKSYYTLFKALQYVIQNGIVVSLSPSIPGICPADETLLVHILEAICYLFVEVCNENCFEVFYVAHMYNL